MHISYCMGLSMIRSIQSMEMDGQDEEDGMADRGDAIILAGLFAMSNEQCDLETTHSINGCVNVDIH